MHRDDFPPAGGGPLLLYGYGAYGHGLDPAFAPSRLSLLDRGIAFAYAHVRGGDEMGHRWYRDGKLAQKPHTFGDFIACAEWLIQEKVTSTPKLAIQGGSNGGLLMGVMLTRYPDLFGAIVCAVPLLDMRRYHLLLAGASWMAEYGDPDDPSDWEYLRLFSPYQNIHQGVPYPPTLITTSTRDDRVHPGHARKMAALLEEHGRDVTYWENTEGGHGGASTPEQWATWHALAWAFLHDRLAGG